MDHALELHPRLRLKAKESAEPAKPRPRPRGPVLMGDLTASLADRPLLLQHWDGDDDWDGNEA